MSAELSSKTYEQHLQEEKDEAQKILDQDPIKAEQNNIIDFQAAKERLEIIEGAREGFRKAGISTGNILVLNSNGVEGGNVTTGLYDSGKDQIGIADLNTILMTVNQTMEAVKKQTEETINHEKGHQHSRRASARKGNFGLIAHHLGRDIDTILQEKMASKNTTDSGQTKDSYDRERSKGSQIAADIGLSDSKLINYVYNGDEDKVVEAAIDSGYIEDDFRHAA